MPKDKTVLYLPFQPPNFAQNRRQTGFHPEVLTKEFPDCVCAAQAILAHLRQPGTVLCADMPWDCPFHATRRTPYV